MQSPAWARRALPVLLTAIALIAAPALVGADVTGPTAPVGNDAASAQQPSAFGSPIFMFVVLAGIMGFMILSSSRQTKAEAAKKQALFESLKPGMRVVTTFGMVAEVERIGATGDTIWLSQGEGKSAVVVEYLRSAIASKYEPTPPATAADKGKK